MLFRLLLHASVLLFAAGLAASGQNAPSDALAEMKGTPPRAAPADYQSRAKAGPLTIAAEFKGHALPTFEGTLESEDYVVVEVALFGAAGAHATISAQNFSLRINRKKDALPPRQLVQVASSLKDPEWEPPETKGKEKEQRQPGQPAPVIRIPFEVRREWVQRARNTPLPEGDRALPVAGLLFFPYSGRTRGIRSVELLYEGPEGQAALDLAP